MKLAEYANHDALGLAALVADGQVTPMELAAIAATAIAAIKAQSNSDGRAGGAASRSCMRGHRSRSSSIGTSDRSASLNTS